MGQSAADAQQPWDARLTGLEASLDASLAQATWHQDAFTTIVTKVFLKDGILTIPQVSARAFGSDIFCRAIFPLPRIRQAVGLTGTWSTSRCTRYWANHYNALSSRRSVVV